MSNKWWEAWSPENVTLADEIPDNAWKLCVLSGVYSNVSEYNGKMGVRISSIFVIFVTSIVVTVIPLLARRWNFPEMCYMIAKMFSSGIILATAFIHLLDPAYTAIGPTSCVGMTGAWSSYSWCSTLIMLGAVMTFLVDIYCNVIVSRKYSVRPATEVFQGANDLDNTVGEGKEIQQVSFNSVVSASVDIEKPVNAATSNENLNFSAQLYGFCILECGIVLHSVMIGLSLGTTGNLEALYAAIAFHQAFEGLGIGARLSSIPFPSRLGWMPYTLCFVYAITTPIAIAAGIGVRSTYREYSYTSLVISGVLDSVAGGVLLYTGFVELIARDFIFVKPKPLFWELNIQIVSLLAGAGVMALIGKWA